MDQTIKHWIGLWDYLDMNFWSFNTWASAHLGPAEVSWQPIPEVASIGWNLWHLGEMLDYYLVHVFGKGPQIQPVLLTMRSGSQDDGRFRDLDAIAAYHHKARPTYRAFLAGLTAADLDRRLGQHSWGWAVGHIAEHESYHLGKCMLLRNLVRSGNERGATG
jgi:hypothetical protein